MGILTKLLVMAHKSAGKKMLDIAVKETKEEFTIRIRPSVKALAEIQSLKLYKKGARAIGEEIYMQSLGITEEMVQDYTRTHKK